MTKALRFIFGGGKPNGPVEAVFPGAAWAARLRGLRHVYRAFVRLERRRYVLAGCLFVLVTASVLMTQIASLLRAMHPVQGGSYGVSDLSRVFSGDPPPHDVTTTWSVWYAQSVIDGHHPAPNPSWLGYWWLGIDTGALVPFYTLLFAVLLLRGYRRIADIPEQRPEANIPAYARIAGVAFFLTPVLALIDWIENVMLAFLVHSSSSGVPAFAVRCVTGAKEFLFLIVVLAVLIVWIAVLRQQRPSLAVEAHPAWVRELRLVRVPAFAVLLFALLFFGPGPLGEQTADVIRRLGDHFDASIVPFALVVLFAAVVAASCRRLLAVTHEEPRQPARGESWWQRSRVSVFALGAGLAALAILVIFDVTGHHPPVGLYFPPALTALIGLLNLAIGNVTRLPPAPPPGPTFVSRLLTAAPLFLFGLAVLRAATGDLFYFGGWQEFILFFVGLAFLAAGVGAYGILEALDRSRGRVGGGWEIGSWVAIGLGCAVALTLFSWTLANEEEVARVFGGTIAMLTGFVILITLVGLGLSAIGEAVVVPAAFTVLRLRRIPVVSLFVLWFAVASVSDRTGYHSIRTFESQTTNAANSTTTLEHAFDSWLATNPPTIAPRAGSERRIRPLVFVASAGGGIRAAYWTDLVLDCLVDRAAPCDSAPDSVPPASLFAVSGVSGGALGLVEYSVHQTRPETGWVRARVGGDFLGAMFAHMFFIDTPNAFLRARWWTDRAAALEGSWERAWGRDSPLRTGLFERGLKFPLLFLNGTSVTDGCRFETSILDIAPRSPDQQFVSSCRSPRLIERTAPADRATWILPATRELQSVICSQHDLRLSTAALLAARFPYVTPSGRVGCESEHRDPAYVVDGGYFEDSGASTVQYVVDALEPLIARHNQAADDCVVPLLIEIDNHYSDTAGPGREARPEELTVPTQTLGELRSAHDAEGRLGGALAFGRVDPPGVKVVGSDGRRLDRVAFVFPRAHPGTEAPLGWAMSNISMNDLDRQLDNGLVRTELQNIQNWFRPGMLACRAS